MPTDLWKETLLTPALNGVEFPIADRQVGTGRAFARYKYPYRNGQGVEDLGRKVFTFRLTSELFRSVDPKHYPGTFDSLMALIDDENTKGEVEYIDPEFGPMRVKIVDYNWNTVAGRRNGGVLTIDLEERGFEQSLLQNLSDPRLAARARANAAAMNADYQMAMLGEDFGEITGSKAASLTDLWLKAQQGLDTAAMSADDFAAQIDELTFVGTKVINFDGHEEVARWSCVNSTIDFLGAAQDAGDTAGDRPAEEAMIDFVLPDAMSMFDIAQHFYGDTTRAEEISFNNPGNPFQYPRGSTVRVFAR